MFGGKKLKDLTEEDIRKYAASLASAAKAPEVGPPIPADPASTRLEAPSAPSSGPSSAPSAPSAPPAVRRVVMVDPRSEAEARPIDEPRKLAQAIADRGVRPEDEGYFEDTLSRQVAVVRQAALEQQEEERRRREGGEQQESQEEAPLSEEELLRLAVLAELERSQMPAVQKDDGILQKTIEHYSFADATDAATLYIELDKDLFEGAAAFVTEANVEVVTKDTEVTILLHRVPVSKTMATALADWRLHLAPLFHSVDPAGTTFKIRKGKVSVRLTKKKPQDWRRVLKF